MSAHDAPTLEFQFWSKKCDVLNIAATVASETRVDLPLPATISTPLRVHQAILGLLGWAAIGLPQPEGWTSEGRTIARDVHGIELPVAAALEEVMAPAAAPIKANVRSTRRNLATLHYVSPTSST